MVRRDKDLRYRKTLGFHLFLQANVLLHLQTTANLLFCIYCYLEYVELILPDIEKCHRGGVPIFETITRMG